VLSKILKNLNLKNVSGWIQKNKLEALLLSVILFLASFFRLYKIDQYLPFLGDEGRDVRVVYRFVSSFDLMFIGPRTSIGDMYLGPLYYYLISPFLFLWNFSPTGPAVFVALLSVATVYLVWYIAREWFGRVAAVIAALLYAISPIVIIYSKHSWNPNIMPFFALLAIYSIWKIWLDKNSKLWFIILGISLGSIIQSHYLGLLVGPVIGLLWLIKLWNLRNTKLAKLHILYSFYSVFIFLLLISPLFLFDYKHEWHNLMSMKTFFTARQETVSVKPWNAFPQIWPFWRDELVGRFLLGGMKQYSDIISIILLMSFTYLGYAWYKNKIRLHAHLLLGLWIVFGLIGLGLLKQNIYDHYYGFLFPAPFLVVGAIGQFLWERKLKWLVLIVVAIFTLINLQQNPINYAPQKQMQRVQEIDQKIIEESGGRPFNFGLIAKRNYDEGYLYFFELWKAQVKEIDPLRINETLTDQLFVVCEDEVCEPINNPQAQIANFGWAKVEKQWEIGGHKLFKLVHHQ
jgi:4-amino-4-deoxy-L-arabinose transferase-like glycosyltransferase